MSSARAGPARARGRAKGERKGPRTPQCPGCHAGIASIPSGTIPVLFGTTLEPPAIPSGSAPHLPSRYRPVLPRYSIGIFWYQPDRLGYQVGTVPCGTRRYPLPGTTGGFGDLARCARGWQRR